MNTGNTFHIEQFEDKGLAHYAYAITDLSTKEIVLIDPARDTQPYITFARNMQARIKAVIETHPHADFVSSHLELHKRTGAMIWCSALTGPAYPYLGFDDGVTIELGAVRLKALNTPGHSPDSISILLEADGKDQAVFSGDTLFIGDCGRPDLRESAGNLTAKKEELARQMYHTLRNVFATLPDEVRLYPAHGAGSLCGKALSDANSSTIGAEKRTNWALQDMPEDDFVRTLLADQPFVPHYFSFDVELNKTGAPDLEASLQHIAVLPPVESAERYAQLDTGVLLIDTRPAADYKQAFLPNSLNLMAGGKFESWLGSIVKPGEPFYLAAENGEQLDALSRRCAKIGYERQTKAAFVLCYGTLHDEPFDADVFRAYPGDFTIVDIRNAAEAKDKEVFPGAVHIPLPELRDRLEAIPQDKPVVVHCAGGYRSAAGASIIRNFRHNQQPVYDLGNAVLAFQ